MNIIKMLNLFRKDRSAAADCYCKKRSDEAITKNALKSLEFASQAPAMTGFVLYGAGLMLRKFLIVILFFTGLLGAQTKNKNVLLINSYHHGLSWTDNVNLSIRNTLSESKYNVNLFIEFLDTKRVTPDSQYFKMVSNLYKEKYKNFKFSAIISTDDDAFYFLLKYRDELFPKVPVVACGLGLKNESLISKDNLFIGVYDDIKQDESFYKIFKLFPDSKDVVFISDQSTTGKSSGKHAQNLASKLTNINPIYLYDNTFEEIIKTIKELPKNALIIPLVFNMDKSGHFFSYKEFMEVLANVAEVPIIATNEVQIGYGALGGYVLSSSKHGNITANIAIRLMDGEDIHSIHYSLDSLVIPLFDFKQLDRYGISESILPEGYVIINKPISFFDQYKNIVIISIIVFLSMSLALLILASNIIKRRQAELKLRNLSRAVEQSSASILITDTKGNIEYVNPKFIRISGYSIDEVIGRNPRILKSGSMSKEIYSQLWSTITAGSEWKGEICNQKKSGELYWEYASISPVTNEKGIITHFVGVKEDITENKKVVEKLRESENKYRKIFENIQDVFFQTDKDGIITEISPSIDRYLGYQRTELIGKPLKELYSLTVDRIGLMKALLTNKEVVDYEIRLKNKNSNVKYVSVNARIIFNSNGKPMGTEGTLRDITERKHSEQEIRKSQAEFNAIFNSILDGIVFSNKERIVVMINPSFEKMFGYSMQDMEGKTTEILYPDKICYEQQKEKYRQGDLIGKNLYEITFKRKNGTLFSAETLGIPVKDFKKEIIGYLGIHRDISDRKRSEEAMLKSESQFRSVWENSFDGMRLTDEKGIMVSVNKAFCEMMNMKKEDLEGKPLSEVYLENHREEILNRYVHRFQIKSTEPFMERELILWNGEKKWFEISNSFIELEKDRPVVLNIFRDITERKKSETEHIRLMNLESLGVFASGISHDFKNILTVISGQASIAQVKCPDENIKKNILSIFEATKKGTELTQQLLNFAKKGIIQKTIIPVRKICETLIENTLRGTNIISEYEFADTQALEADYDQFMQAIQIIIVNAKESMIDGGKFQLSTEDFLENKKHFVKIKIKDTGIGIPKENMDKIFNPYFSTKPRGNEKGSGLGLSVAHSVVKRHGGKILVFSEVGKGTTFELYFPASAK